MKRLLPTFFFAALAVGLAILFYVKSLDLPTAAYQLPRILIAVVILLSFAMIAEIICVHKKKEKTAKEKGEGETSQHRLPAVSVKRILVFIFLIIAYIAAIHPLGYFIVTPFYILITYLYLKATRIRNIITISIGYTLFVYLLFVKFLHLPVPMGIFG